MTSAEATARVFMTAFKALSKAERGAVVVSMAKDKKLMRDMIDLAIIEERRNEPTTLFREYVESRRRRRAAEAKRAPRRPR